MDKLNKTLDEYEGKREKYKPLKIKVLFVGESRPVGNTFFYNENSRLYHHTKNAFEKANVNFSLKNFESLGCWLYDVCDEPVDNKTTSERKRLIKKGLPKLKENIEKLKPEYIIVVKKSDMKKIVFDNICNGIYKKDINAFNLSFPACGHQNEYENELYDIISKVNLDNDNIK
ncbi:MAG: hypothetical protein PHO06_00500 [Clostridia bacterium]|nr:hypothetical protein [Clostridia bacterium]